MIKHNACSIVKYLSATQFIILDPCFVLSIFHLDIRRRVDLYSLKQNACSVINTFLWNETLYSFNEENFSSISLGNCRVFLDTEQTYSIPSEIY